MKYLYIPKPLLFLAGFLFFLAQANAQQLNFTDSKGLKQGLWKTYYPGNVLKSEGSYKDNKPQGLFKLYFRDGQLRAEMTYKPDFKTCEAVLYDSLGGKKMAQGIYINRQKEGEWKLFGDNGNVRSRETYRAGALSGPYKVYYYDDTTSVMEEGIYVNGQRDGVIKQYYPGGNLHSSVTYKAGVASGAAVFYNPDGTKMAQGPHDEKGLRHGMWVKYDSKGVPKDKVEYVHGKAKGNKDIIINAVPDKPIQVETPDGVIKE